jgi:hypothetical protein
LEYFITLQKKRKEGLLNEVILLHNPIEKVSCSVCPETSVSITNGIGYGGYHSRTNSSSSNISYFESIAYQNMELEEPWLIWYQKQQGTAFDLL